MDRRDEIETELEALKYLKKHCNITHLVENKEDVCSIIMSIDEDIELVEGVIEDLSKLIKVELDKIPSVKDEHKIYMIKEDLKC